jgi:hypothetical protein
MKKGKWLYYTVGVGLVPVVFRLFMFIILKNSNLSLYNTADLVFFGLVLNITNFNEVEIINVKKRNQVYDWIIKTIRWSILLIAIYVLLFILCLFNEAYSGLVNINLLTFFTLILNIITFFFSKSIYDFI